MRRLAIAVGLTAGLIAVLVVGGGSAGAQGADPPKFQLDQSPAQQSGIYDVKDFNFGTGITECPQARLDKFGPQPLDRREKDQVEVYSDGGDDRRTNEEFTCFPQNETSIDTNPAHGAEKNIVAGINDYRLGTGSSGFAASSDNGQKWYSGIIPFPSVNPPGTTQGFLVSGGDPAVVFDRAGVVYYAQIAFNRDDDTNGVTVQRSTNGGFTWSRACIVDPPTTEECATTVGDARQPGDGVVSFQQDDDRVANGSIPFDDKEYIAAGPRPDGVQPRCFTPAHTERPCDPDEVGVDRIYVTWTRFETLFFDPPGAFFVISTKIQLSYSDDQGRSWSPQRTINGSAGFCAFAFAGGNQCDDNQFSTPTVHPTTGLLGVSFENFNTPDENQMLFVRSEDGGETFEGPFFITSVFDVNFPRSGATRTDCDMRGQGFLRIVYTNSCFRSNSGGNVVFDRRGGAFADDLYFVMSDNRNGTIGSSNADVFLFKSINGGSTWIGPTRVNNDASDLGDTLRDCGRFLEDPEEDLIGFLFGTPERALECLGNFGNDQWWPWVDINNFGHLNIVFHDRRLDGASTAHEWPTSRAAPNGRPGNYLVWTWGAQCHVRNADSLECLAPGAEEIPQPTRPINPGQDPVPGQGPAFVGTLHNFGIQDVPSNFDYTFRGGIFAGDYNNVAVTPNDTKAYAYWTDARNGRSSGNPTSPAGAQPGRNPICEQSDGMMDEYTSLSADAGQKVAKAEDSLFLVTPCPADATTP
jgi:hypothetical protein